MSDTENRYRENLEALRANEDVIRPLVAGMDEVLANPSYAFEGQIHGTWRQTAGPDSPVLVHRSREACKEFLGDVVNLQTEHALTHPYTGMPQKNESANYATVLRPVEGSPTPAFVRRCGLVGLYGFTHHRTATQYRIEVPTPEVTRTIVLSLLGETAVHAADHTRPTQLTDFAVRCMDAFADQAAVDALVRGDFSDQNQLDELVGRLGASPEQVALANQLRAQAVGAKVGNAFNSEFNLAMPDRAALSAWHGALRLFA